MEEFFVWLLVLGAFLLGVFMSSDKLEIKNGDPIVIQKVVYRCSPDSPKGAR